MQPDYSNVLQRIRGLKSHDGRWHGCCPVCGPDKRGALRLWIDEASGSLRVICYRSRCHWRLISAALDLEPADWFPPRETRYKRQKVRPVTEATYDYVNADGELQYQVLRVRNPDGGKGFSQRRPIPGHEDEWIYSLAAGRYRKIRYRWERLPDTVVTDDCVALDELRTVPFRCNLFTARPTAAVIVVEGEKDVLTLEKLMGTGFIITTNSGGAGKWRIGLGGYLAGRRVAIIPDLDPPGEAHAVAVAASALAYGAEAIRIIRWTRFNWPDLPEGGDITDWLNDLHGAANPAAKKQAILDLIAGSELYEKRHVSMRRAA